MSIESFKDCLRYSIRNPEVVTIGGGEFASKTLVDVLAALDDYAPLKHELELLKATNATNAIERANAERERFQARAERDAAHRREGVAVHNLEAQRERLERLEAIAAAVGACRAFDVSAPILQAFIDLDAHK